MEFHCKKQFLVLLIFRPDNSFYEMGIEGSPSPIYRWRNWNLWLECLVQAHPMNRGLIKKLWNIPRVECSACINEVYIQFIVLEQESRLSSENDTWGKPTPVSSREWGGPLCVSQAPQAIFSSWSGLRGSSRQQKGKICSGERKEHSKLKLIWWLNHWLNNLIYYYLKLLFLQVEAA